MHLTMLQVKDLPDISVMRKFAKRYGDVDIEAVIQFLTILRVGTDLSEMLDNFLANHGLLQGRWWVLILLMREDNLTSTPSVLAEKAGVSRATMTGLIDGLEKEKLVERLSDDTDRRKYAIKLTAAGQAKLDEVMPDYYPRVKQLMEIIPSEQREQLIQQLLQLNNNSKIFT